MSWVGRIEHARLVGEHLHHRHAIYIGSQSHGALIAKACDNSRAQLARHVGGPVGVKCVCNRCRGGRFARAGHFGVEVLQSPCLPIQLAFTPRVRGQCVLKSGFSEILIDGGTQAVLFSGFVFDVITWRHLETYLH